MCLCGWWQANPSPSSESTVNASGVCQMADIRKDTRREQSVTALCVAVSRLGLSTDGDPQITAHGKTLTKSGPNSPASSAPLKNQEQGAGSISSSKVVQIWRKWQAWMGLSCSWCRARRRAVGRQADLQCFRSSLALGLIRDWILL